MTSNNRVQTFYTSRTNLLDILDTLGYNISQYAGFSVNEIDERMKTMQLDMELKNEKGDKVYVKYLCGNKAPVKVLNSKLLDQIIEDLFTLSETLEKKDTLILVIDGEPNDSMHDRLKYLYDYYGYFVVCHNISRLQFNILKHVLVPPHRIMKNSEVQIVRKRYNVMEDTQFPDISRFDPVAQAIGIRPGQVCEIIRPSKTAISANYYRICH
jgi:DNA-directed RNA polymerase subunit H (RpoH/RPB5)